MKLMSYQGVTQSTLLYYITAANVNDVIVKEKIKSVCILNIKFNRKEINLKYVHWALNKTSAHPWNKSYFHTEHADIVCVSHEFTSSVTGIINIINKDEMAGGMI